MRFMVIVQGTAEAERELKAEDQEALAAMGRFNEELVKAGVMLAGEGLHPSSKGVRLSFGAGGKRTVVDGPFAETKELVGGFWMLECASLAEAVQWIKRNPAPEGTEIEIRQVVEEADFGEEFTPELREAVERRRASVAGRPGA